MSWGFPEGNPGQKKIDPFPWGALQRPSPRWLETELGPAEELRIPMDFWGFNEEK